MMSQQNPEQPISSTHPPPSASAPDFDPSTTNINIYETNPLPTCLECLWCWDCPRYKAGDWDIWFLFATHAEPRITVEHCSWHQTHPGLYVALSLPQVSLQPSIPGQPLMATKG